MNKLIENLPEELKQKIMEYCDHNKCCCFITKDNIYKECLYCFLNDKGCNVKDLATVVEFY